jgi:hypothetical protein
MMVTDKFTAKEISVIVKACKESKVSKISYQGLLIEYFDDNRISPDSISEPLEVQPLVLPDTQNASPHSIQQNLDALDELELENLMIDDPLEYEKRMRDLDDQCSRGIDSESEAIE